MKSQKISSKITRTIDTSPSECRIVTFSSSEFIMAVERFINSHYRGLIALEVEYNAMGYIDVSARCFAHFLKMLLSEIQARREIYAKIKSTKDFVGIAIDCGDVEVDFSKMFKIAEQGGFTLVKDKDSNLVNLYTPIKTTYYTNIYSMNPTGIYNTLVDVFAENFSE